MNVTFIIPPSPDRKKIIRMIDCSHEAKANYLWQPNDYLIISSLLQPEDRALLIDGTADALSDQDFFGQINAAPRDGIVFFALSSVCWESDYRYFLQVRRSMPTPPFFVIGDIFLEENYRRLILQDCDGIVFNPYLLDLPGMARVRSAGYGLPGLRARPEQPPYEAPKRPIEVTSGVPRHSLFRKRGYRFPFARRFRFATVTTLWGCPFSCTYCTDSMVPPVIRHPEDVLRELGELDRAGVRELFFADKTFGYSPKHAFPLLRAMADSFRFSWSCYFHPQTYSAGLLDLMRKAGCHTLIIGIDSADIGALKLYRRHVDPNRLEALLAHARRLGLSVCADFILGLGHETGQDVERTIQYALELPIDFASFNIAAPLPGSCIREDAVRAGKLTFGAEGFDTSARSGVIGNSNINAERIRKLRKKAIAGFYMRPSYLFRRLLKTTSLEHFLIQLYEMLSMIRKI